MSDGYGRSEISPITRDQSVRLIVQTCLEENVTNELQIAYVLATAEHETRGFSSLEEDRGRIQAARKGYQGNEHYEDGRIRGLSGENYFGRGYVHLTHAGNYRRVGEALGYGTELLDSPMMAVDPMIAARVLVIGMRDDLFSQGGRGLDHYITADNADYVNARRIVNGTDRAADVAAMARTWGAEIGEVVNSVLRDGVDLTPPPVNQQSDAPLQRGDGSAGVFELQQYLSVLNITNAAGQPLSADGEFGPSTEQAVRDYQRRAGIEPPTGAVDRQLFERVRDEAVRVEPGFRLSTIMDLHGPLNDQILGPGDRGDAVTEVQRQLSRLDYRGHDGQQLRIDSERRYDRDTQAAVRSFQRDEDIHPANGLADERTRDALNARAVEHGLSEAVEVVRRRERIRAEQERQQPVLETNDRPEDRQSMLPSQPTSSGLTFADRYLAAVMSGDGDLVDRIASGFLQAPEGRQLARAADQLAAQQQSVDPLSLHDLQRAPQGPASQM